MFAQNAKHSIESKRQYAAINGSILPLIIFSKKTKDG